MSSLGADSAVVLRTPALHACVEAAQVLAHSAGCPVSLRHLFLSALCGGEPASRARLVAIVMGVHHFLQGEEYRAVAGAVSDERTRAVPLAPSAAAALSRLAYWVTRTGDGQADTAHLLLVCLEGQGDDQELGRLAHENGITERVVLRSALTVRHRVCAADRQARDRGPILSSQRSTRPAPYHFEGSAHRSGPRTEMNIAKRSEIAGAAHLGSRVQAHLIRLHILVMSSQQLLIGCVVAAAAWAAFTGTAWSLLWLASLAARRQVVPAALRVVGDVVLVVASLLLGVPWWLAVLGLANRALDLLDGRLALLEIMGETGDPSLSERGLRADGRADRRAARIYRALKFKGELIPE